MKKRYVYPCAEVSLVLYNVVPHIVDTIEKEQKIDQSYILELRELSKLKNEGILTEEEFQSKKDKILR